MDKQNMYLYMEYYLLYKGSTNTFYDMDEPWKLHAKWKKPQKATHSMNHLYEMFRVKKFIETE